MASEEKRSGISIQTLLISAAASVAAAVIVPMIWERGTLIATAMTPVIVALVSEGLSRPATKVTAAAKTVTQRSAPGAPARNPEFEPLPPDEREVVPVPADDDPFGLRSKPPARRHWKLALATGAAAFAIAVVGLTVSELVFGGPATRDGGSTTFFSGSRNRDATPTPTPTATPEGSATPTATPEATETPQATATPTATPPPAETPAPLEATPTPTVAP